MTHECDGVKITGKSTVIHKCVYRDWKKPIKICVDGPLWGESTFATCFASLMANRAENVAMPLHEDNWPFYCSSRT